MATVLSYEELTRVSEWVKEYFTEEYYFTIEGSNLDPYLIARLPLKGGGFGIEKYRIANIV
jgi:hypothetical protein